MTLRCAAVCLSLISFFIDASLPSQNLNADAELNLGIAAYERFEYAEAVNHLERGVTLDPHSVTGHLHLAEAYNDWYSEECDRECDANVQRRVGAIEEYRKVLELDPSNIEASKALACRYVQSARWLEADQYYRKALEIDPNDFEALYSLAVIQWTRSYQLRQETRAKLKIGRNKPLINFPICAEIRKANLTRVEESIALMTRAREIAPSDDAESYLSILHQERADIQCGDKASYDQDTKTAIDWAQRACATRHRPEHVRVSCVKLRCPPPAPPPPPPGQPGFCPD